MPSPASAQGRVRAHPDPLGPGIGSHGFRGDSPEGGPGRMAQACQRSLGRCDMASRDAMSRCGPGE
eukprot:scaffold30_cov416-Prasinococcus_capsulatus_cf.AAC.29